MALPYRKVVLVEGDLNLTLPVISMIKKSWFPNGTTSANWVEIEEPATAKQEKEYCRTILSEISLDILGDSKVVVLRGFPIRKDFREWLFRLVPTVENPNSLIIWDIDGSIEKSEDPEWIGLRNEVKGHGQCVSLPQPLNATRKNKFKKQVDLYSAEDRLQYVLHAFQSKGCTISLENAQLLLSMIGADRGMIDSEVEKLLIFCNGKSLDEATLRSTVVPVAQDYPIYSFYSAFNSGNYSQIMASSNALLSAARQRKDGKLLAEARPERVMFFAIKQCHWQMLAASLLLHGQDMESGLRKYGAVREVESTRKRVWNRLPFHLKEKAQLKCLGIDEKKSKSESGEEDKVGQETLTTDFMIKNILGFMAALLRHCPPYETNPHRWAFYQTVNRFLTAQNALVQLRLAKGDSAMTLLGQELRKLSF